MINDSNCSNDELENIKDENEFMKMKMMFEHGVVFSESMDGNKCPPEFENEFLKNIEKFEKSFHSAKRISLIKFLGNPQFDNETEIPDSAIHPALDKAIKLLNDNGISLDTICEVDNRTLYKFITEELLFEEVDDVRIDGMLNCFIYEEFHPNHEHDIREHSFDFINSYLNKKDDFYTHFLTKEAEDNGQLLAFRNLFNSFIIKIFEIKNINYDSEKATVLFDIDFTGIIEDNDEEQHYSGEGTFELKYVWEYWCVDKIYLPKIAI